MLTARIRATYGGFDQKVEGGGLRVEGGNSSRQCLPAVGGIKPSAPFRLPGRA